MAKNSVNKKTKKKWYQNEMVWVWLLISLTNFNIVALWLLKEGR